MLAHHHPPIDSMTTTSKLAVISLAKPGGSRWTGAESDNDIVVYGVNPTQRILLGGTQGSSNPTVRIEGTDAAVSGALTAAAVSAAQVTTFGLTLSLPDSAFVDNGIGVGATYAPSSSGGPAYSWASNAASWASNAASWASNVDRSSGNISSSSSSSNSALPLSGGRMAGAVDMGSNAVLNASYVGVGTSTPSYPVHVSSIGAYNVSMYVSGDVQSFSDARVKTDVRRIEGALDKLRRIGGYTFARTDCGPDATRCAGVLAQEVAEVLPEVVHRDADTGLMSVAYGNLLALVIEAVKELDAKLPGR